MNNDKEKFKAILKNLEGFVTGYYSYVAQTNEEKSKSLSDETINFFLECSTKELNSFNDYYNSCDKNEIHYWLSGDISKVFRYLSMELYDENFDNVAENMQKALFSKDLDEKVCLAIYNSRLYKSHEEVEDYILKNYSKFGNDILIHTLTTCSVSKIDGFRDHNIGKVRALVYSRLGVAEYIEEISKDNYAKVRLLALEYMPKNDKRFSLFLNKEKSGHNLCLLASKIRKEHIPYLLSKTSKSAWATKHLRKILNNRLS